ncbi:NTP transferase domain-containing protein [Halovulum sp. GXIMD14793]
MRFGPVPIPDARGAILAHSVRAGDAVLRKGRVVCEADIAALLDAGVQQVVVARPGPDEVGEDDAALALAQRLCPAPREDLTLSDAFGGRVNLLAAKAGVMRVDAGAINALNQIGPGITLATLPNYARVEPGSMLATFKIIPYAVPEIALDRACGVLSTDTVRVHPVMIRQADIVLTRTPGFSDALLKKGETVLRDRLATLGVAVGTVQVVPHEVGAVAEALLGCNAPLILILGASATSDAADVCPAGVVAAGGKLIRFGMPVDPGNLLFLGQRGSAQVIGLPGCARSPALNGADWVLQRLVCGLEVSSEDIAAMGVGGLLKEIPTRPRPRIGRKNMQAPQVEVLLLAAGAARRMRGADKLLQEVDGIPVLRRAANAALASAAAKVHVVLPPASDARRAALDGLAVETVTAADASTGMAASLRAGLRAARGADAVIVMLADMPDVEVGHLDALIAAYDPDKGHEICRAVTEDGQPGHPVLFGRRFFESLSALEGDQGARSVVAAAKEFVTDVKTGSAALLDLDTPEQWAEYQTSRSAG